MGIRAQLDAICQATLVGPFRASPAPVTAVTGWETWKPRSLLWNRICIRQPEPGLDLRSDVGQSESPEPATGLGQGGRRPAGWSYEPLFVW